MIRNLLYTFVALIGGIATIQAQIYDNGPVFNSVGTGAGGANESVLYTTTFGMGTIGFGQQGALFNRIADDITVDCSWTIDSIYFYGYQTGSTTTSTFTGYTLRIWDGVPDAVGSNVIWGDTTTNRLIRSVFSNVYRITETTTGNTTRPIMQNTINVGGFTLPAGTYWFDWAAAGSLASGPWQPARVPSGQTVTGNARQRIGSVWNNLLDGGTGTPAQGAPFKVFGTAAAVTANAGNDATVCLNSTATLGGTPTGTSSVNSPLTYAWQGVGISDTTLSNPTALISTTQQFMVTITDAIGCVAMDTLTITAIPAVPVSVLTSSDTAFCMGISGILTADQTTNISWSTGDTTSSITVNQTGAYMVTYVDVNGCSSSDTAMVNVWSLPTLTVSDLTVCDGDQAQLLGTADYPIFWNDTIANGTTINVTQTTSYIASTVDTNGCVSQATFTVNVNQATTGTTSVSGMDSVTVNGVTYYQDGIFTQTLTNAEGCDSILTITVSLDFTGLNELGDSFSVAPNPMTDLLMVRSLLNNNKSFTIATIAGQVVLSFSTNEAETKVDVSSLTPGTYLLIDQATNQRKLLIKQ